MTRTPKPLDLGPKVTPSDAEPASERPGARIPKPLQFQSAPEPSPPVGTSSRTPRPITVEANPEPTRRHAPRELSFGTDRTNPNTGKVEAMLNRAFDIDTVMTGFKFRLKPRFDTLLILPRDDLINWGERNLTALRDVTAEKVKVARRMTDIDATGWITKTQEAATREPGFFDRFSRQEPPSYYQGKLKEARAQLSAMLPELSKLKDEIFPDAEDLRMDVMALQVFVEFLEDSVYTTIAQNRVQTLIASQQTVMMVLQAIDNAKSLCASHIQTIDELLTITIPNWDIARSSR